jgi:hypothetical protein
MPRQQHLDPDATDRCRRRRAFVIEVRRTGPEKPALRCASIPAELARSWSGCASRSPWPPTMSYPCSGAVAGSPLKRGAVTIRRPSSASALMSARCSHGGPCACACQTSAASCRSMSRKSPITSASAFWRAPCDKTALSSHSLALSRSSATIIASLRHFQWHVPEVVSQRQI